MFIPLGFLSALALPKLAGWQLIGIGLVASTCMELGQLLFISARVSSILDIVTNTLGAAIGIAAVRLVARKKPLEVKDVPTRL
ncbi:UNVERIFIED_ORG: glycopeptide antibiotics resistance protein [Paenarthrobacter nicotinovorans]